MATETKWPDGEPVRITVLNTTSDCDAREIYCKARLELAASPREAKHWRFELAMAQHVRARLRRGVGAR